MKITKLSRENSAELCIIILISLSFPLVYSFTFEQIGNFLKYPLSYGEDGILTLSILKGILQNGWYLENKYLAAPFIQLLYDFPIPDLLYILFTKFMGFLNISHFTVFNILFYLSYSMTGVSSYIVFRKFGLSKQLSLAGSFIFTFVPYHQLRLNHLFLTNYFSIPIYFYYAFKCFNISEAYSKRSKYVTFFLLVVSATSGVYYAFFGCFFICIAGFLSWKTNSTSIGIKRALKYSSIILITIIICIAPNMVWQSKNGKNPTIGKRIFAESEMYGLKIAQLVLPTQDHRLPAFSYLNRRYSSTAPNVNENAGSSLGLIGSLGFLGLILLLFNLKKSTPLDYFTSRLNIAGILFATVGGVGLLFAFFITPQFRGLNRISVFISFLSILYFCFYTQNTLKKVSFSKLTSNSIFWISSAILIVFSKWDQISLQHVPGIIHGYKMFDDNESFFKKIEAELPPDSMIYQLPYVRYPESPMAFKEGYYALLRPYLHSHNLRWSYGQMGYTKDDAWASSLSSLDTEKQLRVLKEFKFEGVLIDRYGYKDNGSDIETAISKQTNIKPQISPDKRYAFYSISKYSPNESSEYIGALPIFRDDWYQPEMDDKSKWIWSKRKTAKIEFQTFNRKKTNCMITFNLQASGPSKVTLKTTNPDFKSEIYDFNLTNNFDVKINLNIEPTGTSLIFESDSNPIQLDLNDNRQFSFRTINLRYCNQTF